MATNKTKLMDVSALTNVPGLTVANCASVYANPASTTTFITEIDIHNTTASSVSIILCIVPNASGSLGTPAATNQVHRITLNAYDTALIQFASPIALIGTNDAIFGLAGTTGVTIQCRGSLKT